MRNKHTIVILMILTYIIILTTACAKNDEKNLSSQKEYTLVVDEIISENSSPIPSLAINTLDNTFCFTYDQLSSYANIGTFEINDGKLIAITDGKERTYIFEIINDNTLKFIAEGSYEIKLTDDNFGVTVTDQAMFELTK